MEIVLWLLAVICAVNVVAAAIFTISLVRDRNRSRRELLELEALWRIEPRSFARSASEHSSARSASEGSFRRSAYEPHSFARSADQPKSARQGPTAGKMVRVALAAAIAFALILSTDQLGAKRVLTSALGVVVPGLEEPASPRSDEGAGEDPKSRPKRDTQGTGSAGSETSGSPMTGTSGAVLTPSGLTAVAGTTTDIHLAWADVADEAGYQIDRSVDDMTGWRTIARRDANVTTFIDSRVSEGTTYFYRVVAMTDDGESLPSDVVSATIPGPPASPTSLTAVSDSFTAIDLVWTDVADEAGYRVERSADGATGWTTIGTSGQDVTAHTNADLSPGTTYFYRVVATNASGDSPPSAVAVATTLPEPDPKPVPDAEPDLATPEGVTLDTPTIDPATLDSATLDPATLDPATLDPTGTDLESLVASP